MIPFYTLRLLLDTLFPTPFIPYYCTNCEKLRQCRDTKKTGKCYNGCLLIKEQKEQQKEHEFQQMIEYYEKHTTYLDKK